MSKPVLVIYDHVRNRVAGLRDHILCTDCNTARWISRDQSARCPCGYTLIMAILRGVAVERESRQVLQFTDYSVTRIPHRIAMGIDDTPKTIEVRWDNNTRTVHGLPVGVDIYCTDCGDAPWNSHNQDGKCRCNLYLIGCISKGLALTVTTCHPIKVIKVPFDHLERESFFGPHHLEYNVWYSHNGRQIMNMPPLPVQCVSCDYTWGQTQWRTDDLESEEKCYCGKTLRMKLVGGHLRVSDGQRMRLISGPPAGISDLQASVDRLEYRYLLHEDIKTTTTETENNDMDIRVNVVIVKAGALAQLVSPYDNSIIWEKLVTEDDIPKDNEGKPELTLAAFAIKTAENRRNDTIANLFADDSVSTDALLSKRPKK